MQTDFIVSRERSSDDMTMVEIEHAIDEIYSRRESIEAHGVSQEEINEVLDKLNQKLEVKATNTAKLAGKMDAFIDALKSRIKAANELLDHYEAQRARLHGYILYTMMRGDGQGKIKSIAGPDVKITYVNKKSNKLVVADENASDLIGYWETRTTKVFNKQKLKDDIESGKYTGQSAVLVDTNYITVKGA